MSALKSPKYPEVYRHVLLTSTQAETPTRQGNQTYSAYSIMEATCCTTSRIPCPVTGCLHHPLRQTGSTLWGPFTPTRASRNLCFNRTDSPLAMAEQSTLCQNLHFESVYNHGHIPTTYLISPPHTTLNKSLDSGTPIAHNHTSAIGNCSMP